MEVAVPPPMLWAQRSDLLFVTIAVECKDIDFKFTEDSMQFQGTGLQDNKSYKVALHFLHKINPDKVSNKNTARCIEYTINKAESGAYWPSLTSDKKKPHFLKVDFNKWVDEDIDEEDNVNMDNFDFMSNLNKFDENKPNFNDLDDSQEDSDDEDLPNLE